MCLSRLFCQGWTVNRRTNNAKNDSLLQSSKTTKAAAIRRPSQGERRVVLRQCKLHPRSLSRGPLKEIGEERIPVAQQVLELASAEIEAGLKQ